MKFWRNFLYVTRVITESIQPGTKLRINHFRRSQSEYFLQPSPSPHRDLSLFVETETNIYFVRSKKRIESFSINTRKEKKLCV